MLVPREMLNVIKCLEEVKLFKVSKKLVPVKFYFSSSTNTDDFSVLVLPNQQHTLKMGTELLPETSGKNLQVLTQLSVRENFVEFSRRERFKTYVSASVRLTKFCPFLQTINRLIFSTWYGMSAG